MHSWSYTKNLLVQYLTTNHLWESTQIYNLRWVHLETELNWLNVEVIATPHMVKQALWVDIFSPLSRMHGCILLTLYSYSLPGTRDTDDIYKVMSYKGKVRGNNIF